MRGRKPTPTALRVLRGNPGKRKFNREEPQPDELSTACPDQITDPEARKEWDARIVPAIETGQITSADFVFAVAHCELWATWQDQIAEAALHAHVVKGGKSEYPMPNPARGMSHKTLMLLAKVDAELGFSPTSRSRVTAKKRPKKKSRDALDVESYFGS